MKKSSVDIESRCWFLSLPCPCRRSPVILCHEVLVIVYVSWIMRDREVRWGVNCMAFQRACCLPIVISQLYRLLTLFRNKIRPPTQKCKLLCSTSQCFAFCSFFIDVSNSHFSCCHRGESGLLRPLSQKRWRLPRRLGHGRELSHRLPIGWGRPWSQGGCSYRRRCHPSLPQPGAAESGRHGGGSQEAPNNLRAKWGKNQGKLSLSTTAVFILNCFFLWIIQF